MFWEESVCDLPKVKPKLSTSGNDCPLEMTQYLTCASRLIDQIISMRNIDVLILGPVSMARITTYIIKQGPLPCLPAFSSTLFEPGSSNTSNKGWQPPLRYSLTLFTNNSTSVAW